MKLKNLFNRLNSQNFLFILFIITSSVLSEKPALVGTFTFGKYPTISDGKPLAKTKITEPTECKEKARILALTNNQFQIKSLETTGFRFVSNVGSIYTLEGCPDNSWQLYNVPGIEYIKNPGFYHPQMDAARQACNIDEVHGKVPGKGFSRSYTGKNVLIGVIDIEFDVHHPAFIDTQGKTKFFALWDQTDNSGASKNRYRYGTIKNNAELQADSQFGRIDCKLHGTHVAGILAGNQMSLPYYGVAPDARLIGVKHGMEDGQLIDAMKWIFATADSLKVPCVINISLGGHEGPHDGTSLFDRAIDSLCGTGKIIVGSAGNDGTKGVHTIFNIKSRDTFGSWVKPRTRSGSDTTSYTYASIDMWARFGDYFTSKFLILDTTNMKYIESSRTLSTLRTSSFRPDTIIVNLTNTKPDTVILQARSESYNPLNRKPHIQVVLLTKSFKYRLGVQLSGLGQVHAWSLSSEPFKSYDMVNFINGDTTHSINEIGGTAKRIISVGAFTTKKAITLWDGVYSMRDPDNQIAAITNYSSRGPTVDGRIKPDICAPGNVVVSAMSRTACDEQDIVIWPNHPQPHGRYESRQGTSMSSPIVAGIAALMLEAKPTMTPENFRQIISETAIKDQFTGSSVNNIWGAGKIDALTSMSRIVGITTEVLAKTSTLNSQNIFIKDNRILFKSKGIKTLYIFDLQGKILLKETDMYNKAFINLPNSTFSKSLFIKAISHDGKEEILKIPNKF